ncbi:phosphotransferase enzyme family protein [Streptomyces sp. bgisy031]|uniref:phosphotransferase enzyme family protein n=1 Tax=Streptomyces sp. bgisy031 TaxID=3413772 RepID=UPI003D75328D
MNDFYDLAPAEQADRLARLAQAACSLWDLGEIPVVSLIKCRENAVFQVADAAGRRHVMRVHRAGYHTPEALESELRWMSELRGAGVATPAVVPDRDGHLFRHVTCDDVPDGRLVDVLTWVAGRPLGSLEDGVGDTESAAAAFRETGRLMARLHDHAEHWQRPAGFTRHAWDLEGLLGETPLWGRFWELAVLDAEQRSLVLAARDLARADLLDFGDTADRYGLIHADFLPENLLVDADDSAAVHLIDFDDAGFGWHLFDIATSLFVAVGEPGFDTLLDAFAAGYRTERDLPDEHLTRLPLFFLLRGLTYLGWLHTRQETDTARELTPVMVEAVTALAADYVASAPVRH